MVLFLLKEINVSTVCHTGKLCYHGAEPEKRFACQAGHKGYKVTQLGMATDVLPGIGRGIKMLGRWGERRS